MTDAAPIALAGNGMGVRFGAVRALDDCSITLPQHGVISLIGENGSGKSTLLDVLSGFIALTSGTLTNVGGGSMSRADLRRLTSRLHQRLVLPTELSVRNYLSICARPETAARLSTPLSFFRTAESHANEELDTLLSAAGIDDRSCAIEHLSWGQQRIVAICGIVAAPKRIVLLDEPFAGILGALGEFVMGVIEKTGQCRLVVFAEHDLRYAKRAERVVVLKAGKVVADFSQSEPSDLALMSYYGG